MTMKKYECRPHEYKVTVHIKDEGDIAEFCDDDEKRGWINAFRDEDEIIGLTINKV